jgi:hypothetical protein
MVMAHESNQSDLACGFVVGLACLLSIRLLTDSEPQHVPLKYLSGQTTAPHAAVAAKVVQWTAVRGLELPSPTPKNIFGPLPEPPKAFLSAQAQQPIATPVAVPVVYTPPPFPPVRPPSPEELAAQQERLRRDQAVQ